MKLKAIAGFLVISFSGLMLSADLHSQDLFDSKDQSGTIPFTGSTSYLQAEMDHANTVNSLSTGKAAEPSAPVAVVQPVTPPPAPAGLNLGLAQVFKKLFEAIVQALKEFQPTSKTDSASLNEDGGEVAVKISMDDSFLNGMNYFSYSIVGQPAQGTARIEKRADGSTYLVYNPLANKNGLDSIKYQVKTTYGKTAESTINFNIAPVNDPVVVSDITIDFDHSLFGHSSPSASVTPAGSVASTAVQIGDSEAIQVPIPIVNVDQVPLSFRIVSNMDPQIATASINSAGVITIVAGEKCQNGTYSFTYETTPDGRAPIRKTVSVNMKNCPLPGTEDPHPHDPVIGATLDLHGDLMPNFADPKHARKADGTLRNIHTLADSGNLSQILAARGIDARNIADDVLILTGDVLLDMPELNINTLALYPGAHLKFATNANTTLKTVNILVTEGAYLEIGSVENPIGDNFKSEVVFKDEPLLGAELDPLQYGNGMVVFGKISIVGHKLEETFFRMAEEPRSGSDTLVLNDNVVAAGWRVGDRIEIPDTRQLGDAPNQYRENADSQIYGTQTEQRTIKSISTKQTSRGLQYVITLDSALQYDHKGAYSVGNGDSVDDANELEFMPHVVNLGRNIVLRSANPEGTRGHSLYTHSADVNIQYASFEDMGRTTVKELNSTKLNADKTVKSYGTNQIGRYSMHFHHLTGVLQDNGYQFTVLGNSVVQNSIVHDFKWGIAVHGSHYGLISQNVVYNARGAGIVTEDGSETGNVFDKNFVLSVTGSSDRGDGRTDLGDFGHDGNGFWFRGTNNIISNNVAADIHGKANNSHFGYKFFPYQLPNSGVLKMPAYQGGPLIDVDANAVPMTFLNNEVYGAAGGISYWWVGMNFETPREGPPSQIQDFKVWHIYGSAFTHYPSANLIIDNLLMINDWRRPNGSVWGGSDYNAYNIILRNSRIEGVKVAFSPSTRTSGGLQVFQNLILRSETDFSIDTLWTSGADAAGVEPRKILIDNVVALGLPGRIHTFIDMDFEYGFGRTSNAFMKDEVFVRNYKTAETCQGRGAQDCLDNVKGADFQVYYLEQHADFIPPATIYSRYGPYAVNILSPDDELTNGQLMTQYHQAVAGAVALNSDGKACTDTIAGVNGLVCGGSGNGFDALKAAGVPQIFQAKREYTKNEKGLLDLKVTWYTTVPTSSKVLIDYRIPYVNENEDDPSEYTQFHTVYVRDLNPAVKREYNFQIVSGYEKGGLAQEVRGGGDGILLPATSAADVTPPVIEDINIGRFSGGVQVRWQTNEWAKSSVDMFDASGALVQTISNDNYITSPLLEFTFKGLKSGELYTYVIKNVDLAGNMTTSSAKSFRVPILTSPAPQQMFNGDIDLTYATIPQSLIDEARAKGRTLSFEYVVDPSGEPRYLKDKDAAGIVSLDGSVRLTGLSDGPHRIQGRLMMGNEVVSGTEFNVRVYKGPMSNSDPYVALATMETSFAKPGVSYTVNYSPFNLGNGHVHCAITTAIPKESELNQLPNVVMDMDKDGKVNLTTPAAEGNYWVVVWPVSAAHQAAGAYSIAPLLVSNSLQTSLETKL